MREQLLELVEIVGELASRIQSIDYNDTVADARDYQRIEQALDGIYDKLKEGE